LPACLGSVRSASELPKEPRRPDGVAIDPASTPPPSRDQAPSSDGLVTLKTPLGSDRAVQTVKDLVRRVVSEDSEGLHGLFTRDAIAVTSPSGGYGSTPQAALWWEQRFRKLDYTKLSGEPVVREAELEVYPGGEGVELPSSPQIRPETLRESDVVVRARIMTTHAGPDRLFGDEIIFWLRREGDRYKIYRMLEEFQLN
jgi:hypothetical protein